MSIARYEIGHSGKGHDPELRYITHSRYDNEWLSVVHSHSIAEMLYILDGEGQIVIGSGRRQISSDEFVIIPPHLMHTEISSSQRPLEYICLGVANMSAVSDLDDFDPIVDLGTSRETVLSLIRGIYREMQRRLPEYEIMAKSLFYNLMVLLVRNRIIDVGGGDERTMRSNIADVKNYMDEHYVEDIRLDQLASIAALSKFHLIREFKAEVGSSPMDYLLGRRITESKNLLAGTELSVSDIAEAVGFSSGSYFSQRFKMTVGMTPLAFRQNSHGLN